MPRSHGGSWRFRAAIEPRVAPRLPQASRWGTIFQREIYDEPAVEPLRYQTLMVPGVADAERGWTQSYTISLP